MHRLGAGVIPKPGAVQRGEGPGAGPPIASSDVISNRQPLLAHFAPKLPAIGKSLLPNSTASPSKNRDFIPSAHRVTHRATTLISLFASSTALCRPMPLEEPVRPGLPFA